MSEERPMKLRGHGLEIDLPPGWEGKIYRREKGHSALHAGTFPLPVGDGDFGSGAVAAMPPDGVFVALLEYDPALAGVGLFAAPGRPGKMRSSDASPKAMHRGLRGKAGIQRFFTEGDRAFCLYVVMGQTSGGRQKLDHANSILRTLAIERRGRGEEGSP